MKRLIGFMMPAVLILFSAASFVRAADATELSVLASDPCPGMNQERVKAGLAKLEYDHALGDMAQAHAEDMVTRGYFDHFSPEGHDLVYRLKANDIPYGYAGENIARGYADCREAMKGWMASKGHRANILNPKFRKFGLGVSSEHWVMDFTD